MASHMPFMDWKHQPLVESFRAFKARMQLFLEDQEITGAMKKATKIKIALGDEGIRRILSSGLTADQQKDPDQIWSLIEGQIDIPIKVNHRVHRLEFSGLRQKPDESISSFMSRLRAKSTHCNFSEEELNERLIEIIIVSTPFDEFRKELMGKPKGYTISEALEKGQEYEAVQTSNASVSKMITVIPENVDVIKARQLCKNCGLYHQPRYCQAFNECPSVKGRMSLKLDSGAGGNTMPIRTYKQKFGNIPFSDVVKPEPSVRLKGFSENYPDACVKLRYAEETYNIEYNASDEDFSRKRKTRLPTRYISSESENEEQNEFSNTMAPPTSAKNNQKRKRRDFQQKDERLFHQSSSGSPPDPPANSPEHFGTESDHPTSSAHRSDRPTSSENSLERRLMIKLDTILENQREQFKFLKQLVHFGTSAPVCDNSDLLTRPIKTGDEIERLSEKLEDEPEYTDRMVSYLSTVGGRSTNDCVRNVIRKIATPQALMNYSFKGQRGKQSFESLFLCQVITKSCMKCKAYKEKDVHLAISDVLRYSKKRSKAQQIDE